MKSLSDLAQELCDGDNSNYLNILEALRAVRAEAIAECLNITVGHCKWVTRKCEPDKEELCLACEIIEAIRSLREGK